MERITRVLAAASLIVLLAACGGERSRDRDDGPQDREKPSLGAPQDDEDDDDEDKNDGQESRTDDQDDAND